MDITCGRKISLFEWPAEDLFVDTTTCYETVDWQYCKEHAHFAHKEACEFIVHLYVDDEQCWLCMRDHMQQFGCSEQFIKELTGIREAGYEKVLLWA